MLTTAETFVNACDNRSLFKSCHSTLRKCRSRIVGPRPDRDRRNFLFGSGKRKKVTIELTLASVDLSHHGCILYFVELKIAGNGHLCIIERLGGYRTSSSIISHQ